MSFIKLLLLCLISFSAMAYAIPALEVEETTYVIIDPTTGEPEEEEESEEVAV